MQNLLKDLIEALSTNDALVVEGKLLKNKVVELALNVDSSIIKPLLNSESLKKHFFTEIDGVLVFDKIKFQKFVSNKEFLPDSYTSFKNKVGLTSGDDYFSEMNDVVLVWPYKDCVLEGGQDKEDSKRSEIFWNEILAPEMIDRLLSPKVLVNFKKINKDGESNIDELDVNSNLVIKGNNLLVLNTLVSKYRNSIKLIYIDPPYNTGTDSFKYNDSFNHSTWLTFMKNRLEVAKQLLKRDGVLFIHIGDSEIHYLKVLVDSIFGRENFVGTIPRKTRSGKDDVPYKLSQDFDWMLVYTNGATQKERLFQRSVTRKYFKSDDFPNDEWRLSDLTKQTSTSERKNSDFTLVNPRNGDEYPANPNRSWSITQETLPKYLEKKKIVFPGDYDFLDIKIPAMRTFKSEEIEKRGDDYDKSYVSSDFLNIVMDDLLKKFTNSKGTEEITNLFGSKAFSFPKNEALMARIIECTTKEGDIVCDFHLGSGTTAAVAHKLGRQYICVEQMDYINDIPLERLKKVIDGEQGGISKDVEWNGGGEFIYCELAKANQSFIDRIQDADNSGSLLSIWDEMQNKAFLSYKVNIESFNESVSEFSQLTLDEQKSFLIEVLDKNMLYVPLSEIDDESFAITEEDKAINKKFFGNS